MTVEDMREAIKQIDRQKGIYVVFEVMTDQGPNKRIAYDYITGRAIIDGWQDRIYNFSVEHE